MPGELAEWKIETIRIELDAHQEPEGLGVGVLVGVQDVATMAKDEFRDGGDQTFLVGTADEENGAGSHECFPPWLRSLSVRNTARKNILAAEGAVAGNIFKPDPHIATAGWTPALLF